MKHLGKHGGGINQKCLPGRAKLCPSHIEVDDSLNFPLIHLAVVDDKMFCHVVSSSSWLRKAELGSPCRGRSLVLSLVRPLTPAFFKLSSLLETWITAVMRMINSEQGNGALSSVFPSVHQLHLSAVVNEQGQMSEKR